MSEFIQRHIGPSESEQRKMLADLAVNEPAAFAALVERSRAAAS